jgi:hypothetical protein
MMFKPEEYIQRLKNINDTISNIDATKALKNQSIFFTLMEDIDRIDSEMRDLTNDILRRSCMRRFELYQKWSNFVEKDFLGTFVEFCDVLESKADNYTFGKPREQISNFTQAIKERYETPPSEVDKKEIIDNFKSSLFFYRLWDDHAKENFPLRYYIFRLNKSWFIKEETSSENIQNRIFSINHMLEDEIELYVESDLQEAGITQEEILCIEYDDKANYFDDHDVFDDVDATPDASTHHNFNWFFSDRFYVLLEYRGRIIRLPTDEGCYLVSQATYVSRLTYKDTKEPLGTADREDLVIYLTNQSDQEGALLHK